MVKFRGRIPPGIYKLGRVSETKPDEEGNVRTVKVTMLPKDSRDVSLPYKAKNMLVQDISVQRLVVIVPVEEQTHLIDVEAGGTSDLAADPHLADVPDETPEEVADPQCDVQADPVANTEPEAVPEATEVIEEPSDKTPRDSVLTPPDKNNRFISLSE